MSYPYGQPPAYGGANPYGQPSGNAPPMVNQGIPPNAPPSGYNAPPTGYNAPPTGYNAPPTGYNAPPSGYAGSMPMPPGQNGNISYTFIILIVN